MLAGVDDDSFRIICSFIQDGDWHQVVATVCQRFQCALCVPRFHQISPYVEAMLRFKNDDGVLLSWCQQHFRYNEAAFIFSCFRQCQYDCIRAALDGGVVNYQNVKFDSRVAAAWGIVQSNRVGNFIEESRTDDRLRDLPRWTCNHFANLVELSEKKKISTECMLSLKPWSPKLFLQVLRSATQAETVKSALRALQTMPEAHVVRWVKATLKYIWRVQTVDTLDVVLHYMADLPNHMKPSIEWRHVVQAIAFSCSRINHEQDVAIISRLLGHASNHTRSWPTSVFAYSTAITSCRYEPIAIWQLLDAHNARWDPRALLHAAQFGYLALIHHCISTNKETPQNLFTDAIMVCTKQVLQALLVYADPSDTNACSVAAEQGLLSVLIFLRRTCGFGWDHHTMTCAIANQQWHVITWLLQQPDCPFPFSSLEGQQVVDDRLRRARLHSR